MLKIFQQSLLEIPRVMKKRFSRTPFVQQKYATSGEIKRKTARQEISFYMRRFIVEGEGCSHVDLG